MKAMLVVEFKPGFWFRNELIETKEANWMKKLLCLSPIPECFFTLLQKLNNCLFSEVLLTMSPSEKVIFRILTLDAASSS